MDAEEQKSSSLASSVNSWMSFRVCLVSFNVFTASAAIVFAVRREKVLLLAEVRGGRPFQDTGAIRTWLFRFAFEMLTGSAFCPVCFP